MRYFLILIICFHANLSVADQSVNLDQIVVTPSRVVESLEKAGSNVTVISSGTIEASGSQSLPEVLERHAGVRVYSQSSPKNQVVDVRGQGDTAARNILVLVNGRRVNPVDISGPDWLQIPVDAIERVEVIRGSGSVLYGDNANAGVVNIITKKGAGKPYLEALTETGSFGLERYSLQSGGEKGQWDYYVNAAYSDLDGYRSNSSILTKDGDGRVGYTVNDNVSLDLETGWHKDRYGLPGGLSAAGLRSLGRRGSDSENDYAAVTDSFARLSSQIKPFEADGSLGVVDVDYSHRNRDTFGFLDYGAGFSSRTKRDMSTDAGGLKYTIEKDVAGHRTRLITGVDLDETRNSIVTSDGADLLVTKRSEGVYASADVGLTDRLFANAGARYQEATYLFDQYNTSTYEQKDPNVTVYNGGLRYEYSEESNVFASVSETFRFLATDEWFSEWSGLNTSLRHQEGIEYQTGVNHRISKSVKVNATGFYIRNKDEIFVDPTLVFGLGDNSNYGRTERAGLELGADVDLVTLAGIDTLKAWTLFADATLQSPEFGDGAFEGKRIPFVPETVFKAGTGVTLKSGWGADLIGRYTGSQFPINDVSNNRPKVKGFVVVDTRVRYNWKDSEAWVGVNNVFNEKYNDYVAFGQFSGNTDYYPAPTRNWVAGVKRRF